MRRRVVSWRAGTLKFQQTIYPKGRFLNQYFLITNNDIVNDGEKGRSLTYAHLIDMNEIDNCSDRVYSTG